MERVRKDFLVCIDSDGCAMDTMDCKHIKCFGPCLVETWQLERYRQEILDRWNEMNLYSRTRGINRFKGLVMMLTEIDHLYEKIDGLGELKQWVEDSKELSNRALQEHLDRLKESDNGGEHDCAGLEKALQWSEAVNISIDSLTEEEKKPFPGVSETLKMLHEQADIAVVSSANQDAVECEWRENGLLEHVDHLMTQNMGSKQSCIAKLIESGYSAEHVLMVGDAPGDHEAAGGNQVRFFPIIPKQERQSWEELRERAMNVFLQQSHWDAYEEERVAQYFRSLDA